MEPVIFVPIEQLEERYSAQWYGWFMEAFRRQGVEPIVVGDREARCIKTGQFLDVHETNIYKAGQLKQVLEHIAAGFRGTVFFMDLWFPGLEALAYVRDALAEKIRIKGIFHAGTWDPWDYLTQRGMGQWAEMLERSWLKLADEVYVATGFHFELLSKRFDVLLPHLTRGKVKLVKFPVYEGRGEEQQEKENIVVFPHRLAPEKDPVMFEQVRQFYEEKHGMEAEWIRTKDVCKTKADYYRLLGRAKVAFSAARQETFGIAMLEAYNLGCLPVVPDGLSYQETIPSRYRYQKLEQAVRLIHWFLNGYDEERKDYVKQRVRSVYTESADGIIDQVLR
jgi:glycosyltransferase involved in cell wall biosynthesis